MNHLLEIKNLNFTIHTSKLLKNISLNISKGKIIGMIGGSGSGKTTLIRTILNIHIPANAIIDGDILVKGEAANLKNRRLLQPVFQDPGSYFNPMWNLQECLEEPMNILFSYSKEKKLEEIKKQLEEFSIPLNYLTQSIKRFSGGELQRISFARAILCKPEILLMDEPVSGLDPLIQKDVIQLIRELNQIKNITIFLISHDIDFISSLCDFIYVIKNGEIVECNQTKSIIENPDHEYTKLILKSRNLSEIKK